MSTKNVLSKKQKVNAPLKVVAIKMILVLMFLEYLYRNG